MSYSHHCSSSLPPLPPSLPPPPPSLPSHPMVPMPFVPLSVRVRCKVPLKGSPVLHHFHGVRQPVAPHTFVLPLPRVVYRCTLWYPCTAHSPQLLYPQGAHPSIFLSSCYRGPRFLRERLRLDVFIRFLRTLVSISPYSIHLPIPLLNPLAARPQWKMRPYTGQTLNSGSSSKGIFIYIIISYC